MPVVLRVGGFAFKMYPEDHAPPHVHVRYGRHTCKGELATLLLSRSNLTTSEEARAVRMVAAHGEILFAAWAQVVGKGEMT